MSQFLDALYMIEYTNRTGQKKEQVTFQLKKAIKNIF